MSTRDVCFKRGAFLFIPSWSAKGYGEAIELLIARWMKLLDSGIWLFLFCHTMPAGLHDLHNKCKRIT